MAAIITDKFRIHNAESYIEGFSESAATNIYLFIGRPQPWTNDTSPDTPVDNPNTHFNAYDDIVALKRVNTADVSHAIVRRNWTSGTTYDAYQHDYSSSNTANSGATSLSAATFYVLTEDFNVYKVIDNDGNTASTVKPTGTGTGIITTGDGYKWKFMYTISASDAISGNGSSATATATVAGNAVTAITVNNVGTGYNQATVTISGGGGSGATAVAVISPEGGHSSNPVHELGGFYVMNNVRLEYADGSGDFPVSNDYRRIGLIRDPFDFGTTNVATAATLSACKTITLQSGGLSGTFQVDETITGGTSSAQGKVVNWDSTNRILKYYQDINTGFGTFQTSETISGGTSSASGTSSALGNPEVAADSGDIMYLEHRRPINRASDQIEDIKLVVEF